MMLLTFWFVLGFCSGDQLIGPGTYPRGVSLLDGSAMVCVGMDVYENRSTSSGGWQHVGKVRVPEPGSDADLGNCNLFQLKSGRLLASYRHHTGCGVSNSNFRTHHTFACANYSIQVSFSDDRGQTWGPLSTVITGRIGMWEPFFFELDATSTNRLTIAYSQELTNGGLQSIVWQESVDRGQSWGAPTTISDGTEHYSRDGMPGITRLADGSLACVFEGFWASDKWGHFSVQMRRSFDNGKTWNEGEVIYAAAGERNAGAPQVSVSPTDGTVFVSFMTDEDGTAGSWPIDASAKALFSSAHAGAGGTPVTFLPRQRLSVCTGPKCMWPGVFNSGNFTWLGYEHLGSSYLHQLG
jgi:hypothetical protein